MVVCYYRAKDGTGHMFTHQIGFFPIRLAEILYFDGFHRMEPKESSLRFNWWVVPGTLMD